MKESKFSLRVDLKTYMMVIALVAIWLIFTGITGGTFLSPRNLSNLFRQSVFTSILAIGMVMVIITGHIDLSAGSLAGLTGGIVSILHVWRGWNPYPSIAVTLIVGLALGLWNGYWVAYKKVPAFIVTLGGLLVFRGALVGITKGTTIGPMGELFRYIGKGYLPQYGGIILAVVGSAYFLYVQYRTRKGRLKYDFEVLPIHLEILKSVAALTLIAVFVLVMNSYQGVPVPLIGLLVLFFIFSFVTKNTVFGRHIYAIGGNSEAAQMSGINVARTTLLVFVLNGLMAAIGGILMTARLNAASVAAGQNAELDAIAACVIGGTSLMGGIGSVGGAVIGAVVMASLDNGMSLLNVPMFWQSIVKGLVLGLAVWFDVSSTKK